MTASNIYPIDPHNPQQDLIAAAAASIRSGKIAVYPTSGLYGLGADARNHDAVARIFEIKGRSGQKPVSILVGTSGLTGLVADIPPAAAAIMDRFWPGGITVVFEADAGLPHNLTAGTGKIGIRRPLHPVAVALVEAVGGPVTATSANLSGQPGCADIRHLAQRIAERADRVLDAGPLAGGAGSTVVDVTCDPPTVLRRGAVAWAAIQSCLRGQ